MTSAVPTLELGKQASENPTILIIEDYPDTRQMISMLLTEEVITLLRLQTVSKDIFQGELETPGPDTNGSSLTGNGWG